MTRRLPHAGRALLALTALLFLAGPAPGDIGCSGQQATDLDPAKFFGAKQFTDCQRCTDCGITTQACKRACGPSLVGGSFPDMCEPLVHDGEVCLDALEVASCSDYQSYMADQGSTTPTECDFCPPRDAGAE